MRWHQIDTVNLILASLLAGLLLLVFKPTSQAPALININPQVVNELRIERHGQVQLALLKDAAGWQLTHPLIARANSQRVAQLLGLLQAPGMAVDAVSPQAAGLQPPALRLHVDQSEIDFGGPSVPAGQRYVRVNQQVYLIDDHWYRLLTLPASFYQAK